MGGPGYTFHILRVSSPLWSHASSSGKMATKLKVDPEVFCVWQSQGGGGWPWPSCPGLLPVFF